MVPRRASRVQRLQRLAKQLAWTVLGASFQPVPLHLAHVHRCLARIRATSEGALKERARNAKTAGQVCGIIGTLDHVLWGSNIIILVLLWLDDLCNGHM